MEKIKVGRSDVVATVPGRDELHVTIRPAAVANAEGGARLGGFEE